MKMEQTECFETSAYKIQAPGNYPEENIQHQFCLQGSSSSRRLLDPRRWDWYVVSKRRKEIINMLSRNVGKQLPIYSTVTSQKSEGLNYTAAEAWNLANYEVQ